MRIALRRCLEHLKLERPDLPSIANTVPEYITRQLMSTSAESSGRAFTDVCIVGAARTPFGSFLGSLAPLSATQLGSLAIRGALDRASLQPSDIQEVFMGNVLSANLGQAPARQAALGAGLPEAVICTTINKVCASGLKAVMLAALTIQSGLNDLVVAGGMESMSNCPHYLPGNARANGLRMGHARLVDGMLHDGLWDPYSDTHMGECAEQCASERGITRERQDAHALRSVERARTAQTSGATAREIVTVDVPASRGKPATHMSQDEPLSRAKPERLPSLSAVFVPEGGTVTAGNSSPITDGAAALVLASTAAVARLKLPVLAHIIGMGDAAQQPRHFTTTVSQAIPQALANARLSSADVDYYEINEAFSVVDLVNRDILGLDDDRVNIHGGAVALGHPIGASGAAILVRLVNILTTRSSHTGIAAICNGGGGASAVVIQR